MKPFIIFEDNDIVVINKPAGVTVNRSETTKEDTIQDWSTDYLHLPSIPELPSQQKKQEGQYPTPEEAFLQRGGIVHRLDKETSGILLIAKNPKSFEELQRQFKERIVSKTYLALSHGKLVPKDGEINVPVGRLNYNRMRFGVVAGGRESITHYHVLNEYINTKNREVLSLVELYPKTGRTHQIRVHLKYLNRPIFGDELYAGRKVSREDRRFLPRVFLHAAKITFLQPTTQKEVTFEAPLAPELQQVLDSFTLV